MKNIDLLKIRDALREYSEKKWNCKRSGIWYSFEYDPSIIYVHPNLIGMWDKFMNKFTQFQLEEYMVEYIRWFVKNNLKMNNDFEIKFDYNELK